MKELVDAYLQRIDWDERGIPMRLYPFARRPIVEAPLGLQEEPKYVVINPKVEFGRPVIVGTGIRTAALAQRFWAGDPIDEIAHDFNLSPDVVSQAIRYQSLIERAEQPAA
jgi:uncharacterized protein (DUF433 family)